MPKPLGDRIVIKAVEAKIQITDSILSAVFFYEDVL